MINPEDDSTERDGIRREEAEHVALYLQGPSCGACRVGMGDEPRRPRAIAGLADLLGLEE